MLRSRNDLPVPALPVKKMLLPESTVRRMRRCSWLRADMPAERRRRIGEGEALGESRGNYEERLYEREEERVVERQRGCDGYARVRRWGRVEATTRRGCMRGRRRGREEMMDRRG